MPGLALLCAGCLLGIVAGVAIERISELQRAGSAQKRAGSAQKRADFGGVDLLLEQARRDPYGKYPLLCSSECSCRQRGTE